MAKKQHTVSRHELHDASIEANLLGCLIHDKDALSQIPDLSPTDFYSKKNQEVFKAIRELHRDQKPIDFVILIDHLRSKRKLTDAGEASYVSELEDNTVFANLQTYANTVRDYSLKRRAHDILLSGLEGITDRDVDRTVGSVAEKLYDLRAKGGKDEEDLSHYLLFDKQPREEARDPDKPLGYPLTKFETLSKNIDGIRPGFYIIGAETNVAKTAFLCNLTLDLLETTGNENLTGLYYSLDDNKDVIINRLLGIKADLLLNQVERKQRETADQESLKRAYAELAALSQGQRLFIRDISETNNIEDLQLDIRRKLNRELFVVIDGLYNLDVGEGTGDARRENIERANRLKAIADTYRIPVICTGELRKKERKEGTDKPPTIHDLMETGKFAYNANLVLLLYPEKWEDYDNEDEPVLKMKYAKNKLSHYRLNDRLIFKRNKSQIEEPEKPIRY